MKAFGRLPFRSVVRVPKALDDLDVAARSKFTVLVLVAVWTIGVAALAVVIRFQAEVGRANQAQVVVQTVQRQIGDLTLMAFGPALAPQGFRPTAAQSRIRLDAEKRTMLTTLDQLGTSAERSLIESRIQAYLPELNSLADTVAVSSTTQAAIGFRNLARPGGPYAALLQELRRASTQYGARATRSRMIGVIGEITALVFVLVAFSFTAFLSMRFTREKHRLLVQSRAEALTDTLTGLPNRRKLFLDMEALLAESPRSGEIAVGMLDLNGFKNYNDTFGHPAGDALLARLGKKLAATINGLGSAYRMGGDEFCVIGRGPDPERSLSAAALALSESGDRFAVTCALGSVLISSDEMTLEQALQQADQRLYDDKRANLIPGDGEAHDVLLRILSENSVSLASHLTTVGRLAEAVARKLGLSEDEVTLTRLTAELHDVGKTAIPDAILDKRGPLDAAEWAQMKRHTIIGERILAAAPALAAVAPLVRSSHERPDGTGYPDGLREDEIPVSSRIVAVVDAYDAMTSVRPYSLPLTPNQAISELRRCAGTQFDAAVAEAFIAVWQESPRRRPSYDQNRPATAAA